MKKIILLIIFMSVLYPVDSRDKQGYFLFNTSCKIIYDIDFTEKGEALAIADNMEIKIYSTVSKELLQTFKNGHRGQILSIDISKDSTLLASAGKDSTIVIWDFISGKIIKKLSWSEGIVTSVEISPDGKYLVAGASDDKAYLYDIARGVLIKTYAVQNDDILCVAFSPTGKLFVIAGAEGLVKVYSIETGDLITSLSGHSNFVRDLSFNGDGTRLLSCGDDSRIITWNFSDIKDIFKTSDKQYGKSWLLCGSYRADGDAYAYGSVNGSIEIKWSQGIYKGRLGVPVNRVLFYPVEGPYLQIAVATRGKGVMLIDGSGLKLKNK